MNHLASRPSISKQRGGDRRQRVIPVVSERRGQGERRRNIDPTTCERSYTHDEIEFMNAMDQYRRRACRPFPNWGEVLEVLRSLGYRREGTDREIPPPSLSLSKAPVNVQPQHVSTQAGQSFGGVS